MKKVLFTFVLLMVSLSVAAGCSSNAPKEPTSNTQPAQNESKAPSSDQVQTFRAGTWLAKSKDTAAYYFFDADGVSGRTASLETGMGVGFSYTVDGERIVFRMGSADAKQQGVLSITDDTAAAITWEDGREESMTFVSEQGSDAFHFFSNEELCAMATAYYKETTGEAAPQAAADLEFETVTIQLYHNLGDHNSTCAWYQVNRITGKGTDVNSGQEINFADYRQTGEDAGNQ